MPRNICKTDCHAHAKSDHNIQVRLRLVQKLCLQDRITHIHTDTFAAFRDADRCLLLHPCVLSDRNPDRFYPFCCSFLLRSRYRTWQSYSPIEETDYFTYDEFSAWIENETENIQKLVDAGEWTEAEATEALEYYDEILKSILEGKMVGKRASSSDDQLFFSMPDNAQPEQYQTFVFDGNTCKSIGPFDTEEELFNALKEYTDTEVEAGTMSQAEATALLEKYQ